MCNGTLFTVEKSSPQAGLEPGTARSVGQSLIHSAAGAPRLVGRKIYRFCLTCRSRSKSSELSFICICVNRALDKREYLMIIEG